MILGSFPVQVDRGITSVGYSNSGLVSAVCWSGDISIYQPANFLEIQNIHEDFPLICSSWITQDLLAAGSIEGTVYFSDSSKLKAHESGISSIGPIIQNSAFFSSSWDGKIKLWDVRTPQNPTTEIVLGQKILTAASITDSIITACGGRQKTFIVDVRNPSSFETRVSSLQEQMRSIAPSRPDSYGWACGSIGGRIAIEYLGDIKHQAQRFSFHCHRKEKDEKIIVYAVNSLSFHPKSGILASGGSNGTICFWDLSQKRKISELHGENCVSSICFSPTGDHLCISFSDMKENASDSNRPDRLVLYDCSSIGV